MALTQRERSRRYRDTHGLEQNAKTAAWRKANPEQWKAIQKASYAKHREKRKADRRAKATPWRKHGLSDDEYWDMVKRQYGVCALCKRPPKNTRLCVDHCHATGRIRGLLCTSCNTSLGKLGDDVSGLQKALDYLQAHAVG